MKEGGNLSEDTSELKCFHNKDRTGMTVAKVDSTY